MRRKWKLLVQKSQKSRPIKNPKKTQSPQSKNILIPFVKEIVPVVNFEQSIIEIIPPEGLIDLWYSFMEINYNF